jgi:hypothetical protein
LENGNSYDGTQSSRCAYGVASQTVAVPWANQESGKNSKHLLI